MRIAESHLTFSTQCMHSRRRGSDGTDTRVHADAARSPSYGWETSSHPSHLCITIHFFSPLFSGFSLSLSLSLLFLLLLPCVSHPTHLRPHDALLSRHVPSALKRSIEAVYRILQKKTLPLATRRVEKELLPIKKARTRFFFFFERPCSRPRGVNAFYGPRIQWLPPTIPLHLQ